MVSAASYQVAPSASRGDAEESLVARFQPRNADPAMDNSHEQHICRLPVCCIHSTRLPQGFTSACVPAQKKRQSAPLTACLIMSSLQLHLCYLQHIHVSWSKPQSDVGPPFAGVAAAPDIDAGQRAELGKLQEIGCVPALRVHAVAHTATKLRSARLYDRCVQNLF